MVGEINNESEMKTTEVVVEKRIKPTVIRRRAKKVEVPKPPVEEQVVAQPPSQEVGTPEAAPLMPESPKLQAEPQVPTVAPEEVTEKPPVVAPSAEKAPETAPETAEGGTQVDMTAPSAAEKRIGVVGYIDLSTTQVVAKPKDDWKERFKKGARRRKNKAELEMEAIQRTGGLKQFVGQFAEGAETSNEPGYTGPAVADRVFQPTMSKRRKAVRKEFQRTQITERKAIKRVIRIEDGISVSSLSQALGIKANEIIRKLMELGQMATINQAIDAETASLIVGDYGFSVEHTAFKEEDVLVEPEAHISVENLQQRAPVVTIMGHVDHGKTSILDAIREANVTAGEAGGITQHIGAYEIAHPKGTITFLDTPGHEAFTTMRARGAQATDIVILVVAADDGVMPQTVEAISHAKAAGVPIIVAVNKIDKQGANPDRVKQALTEHGLVPEEWGGDIICVGTSAKTREGLTQLLDMILLQSEMLELKADPTIRPKGLVVEASLDKSRGPVATILIQEGTLRVGDYVVCGSADGKVRAMFNHEGAPIEEASLSKPVEILGLGSVPAAGDEMVGVSDDKSAKMVAEQRRMRDRERELTRPVHISLEDLSRQMLEGETKELGAIIKADVQGSLEAVRDALEKLSTNQVKLKVLHGAVGGITESDIMLASASDAVVLGFNVMPDVKARHAAERENIDVRSYRVIYEMIDEVRKAMEGLLAPEEKEVTIGSAEVREVFKITKVGTIAGCYVTSGKIQRNAKARLLRESTVVFEGKLSSLKRFKDDAKEVSEGYECGIGLENFNDLKVGDVIDAYIIESKAATLS